MRGAEADRVGDVARAGLEARGRRLVDGLLEGDVLDHVAAALPGRRVIEHVRLAVQRADAGRARRPCGRRKQTVAVELLHVDAHVRDRLRAIDQHARAVAMGHLDHLAGGSDGAERVRDLREATPACVRGAEQLLIFVEQNLAVVIDRRDAQCAPVSCAQLLPGHDVGVVLQPGDDDLVALV